jgi:hypothetical protein
VGERTDPLLIDLPEQIATARLTLRPPRPGDGPVVNAAVLESIEDLQPWMPWATPAPTVEQSELWCRKAHADFVARRRIPLLAFLRDEPTTFVVATGMPRMNWDVPWFEIGYWVRTSRARQGYASESAASGPSESRSARTTATSGAGASPSGWASRSKACCGATVGRPTGRCATPGSMPRSGLLGEVSALTSGAWNDGSRGHSDH